MASPVLTSWMTGAKPSARSFSIQRMSVGTFMAVTRWLKKRTFAPSNADLAAPLAFPLRVPPSSLLMPVAFRASSRLL